MPEKFITRLEGSLCISGFFDANELHLLIQGQRNIINECRRHIKDLSISSDLPDENILMLIEYYSKRIKLSAALEGKLMMMNTELKNESGRPSS